MPMTSVASTTASTVLLASRTRKGGTITNTDANTLYVILDSAVASSTNYTVALRSGDYYELPAGYIGEVGGVWAADGSGSALVTEF